MPHDILVSELESHGFDRGTTSWIRNCLDGHTQSCSFNVQIESSNSNVPQGLVLGPMLFKIFAGDSRINRQS